MSAYVPPHRRRQQQQRAARSPNEESASTEKPYSGTNTRRVGGSGRFPKKQGWSDNRARHKNSSLEGAKIIDKDGGMVYELPDGSVHYYQDRNKKYPFQAGPEALPLLRGLLETNKRVFMINRKLVDATNDVQATIQQGKTLYAEKPTMKQHHGALGTWSNDEYAHPGFQCEYLHLKSFQRFTESWSLFERAAQFSVFDRYLETEELYVVSLGGGPGYELLAFEWFFEYWAMTRDKSRSEAIAWLCGARNLGQASPDLATAEACSNDDKEEQRDNEASAEDELVEATRACSIASDAATASNRLPISEEDTPPTRILPQLKLASLDLQPTWEPYVLALPDRGSKAQYSFAQWNIKDDLDAIQCSGFPRIDVCIISNLLVYCSDESTADVITDLFTVHGVHAILVNERGGEQKILKMLVRRGVVVVRLMDQSCGVIDDRQLLLLPPGTTCPELSKDNGKSQDVRSQQNTRKGVIVFPNVPFEEHKHAMASQRPHSSSSYRRRMPGYAS